MVWVPPLRRAIQSHGARRRHTSVGASIVPLSRRLRSRQEIAISSRGEAPHARERAQPSGAALPA